MSYRILTLHYVRKVTLVEANMMQLLFRLRRIVGMTVIFKSISRLGDWPLWLAIGLVLSAGGGAVEHRAVLLAGASIVLSVLLFKLLKNLTGRPRPFETHTGLTALMAPPDKFSFPSGHTMSAFAIYSSFLATLPWLAPWVLSAAVLIGLSRIYLGLHYPTDVLMGALLGTLTGQLVTRHLLPLVA